MTITITELLYLLPLIVFSVLAFWKESVILFMLTAGIALMTGLTWYDTYGTDLGLTISLILIAYSIVCFGMGFSYILRSVNDVED